MFYVQVTGVCTGEILYVQVNRSIYSKNASRMYSRNILCTSKQVDIQVK